MTIGVIGLGLIGGSVAKGLSEKTHHTVLGYDIDKSVLCRAKLLGAVKDELSLHSPSVCDIIIIALYPQATIDVFSQIAPLLKKGTVVIDCCGIKESVCNSVRETALRHGICFIGGHPMAGIEKIGFDFSSPEMFRNASMILTPFEDTDIKTVAMIKQLFLSLGFGNITIVSPKEHDRVIAYTSQLAHVLSSAYVKSPTAKRHSGMSAGSFKDMTRVAYLNEKMWTELFFKNRENLLSEINTLVSNLCDFEDALKNNDSGKLTSLLRDGRIIKENL